MFEENVSNMDVLFINPSNSKEIYQGLASKYSAIEPPTWSLLLAQSCRSQGFNVGILDVLAEGLSHLDVVDRISKLSPRFICFVVYGQNVNAGTAAMSGAVALSSFIKEAEIKTPIAYVGSYVQALPHKALLDEKSIDIVFTNEGVYALHNILKLEKFNEEALQSIQGIGYRHDGKIKLNQPEKIVPQERMDQDLPGYAWDLLPFREKPFDLYRSPMWHAEYDEEKRSPYAAIQTSLGCNFGCSFCMINIINRNDNDPIGVASNYSKMRHWSTDFILKEFDKLAAYGVYTIKVTDEMFLLNQKYYLPLCKQLSERSYSKHLRMWAYSRIDTVRRPEVLEVVRKAGIKWLCLGIESSNKKVRLEVSKGKFEDVDIKEVINKVHEADIEVLANYIFGLPGDDMASLEGTLELSKELCTIAWNGYAAMALPGSKLYKDAVIKGYKLPDNYAGYSFHAYNTQPLPTDHLTPEEILTFRDKAFNEYHSYPPFLEKVVNCYGEQAKNNILDMLRVKLKRKILEDSSSIVVY